MVVIDSASCHGPTSLTLLVTLVAAVCSHTTSISSVIGSCNTIVNWLSKLAVSQRPAAGKSAILPIHVIWSHLLVSTQMTQVYPFPFQNVCFPFCVHKKLPYQNISAKTSL